jgi:glycosyltransferase involved in cell wall biosynthesis
VRILFVDVFDAESALNWSGTTSKIFERLRMREDVILCHKLNRIMRYLYLPYILECKVRGFQTFINHRRLVARHYAAQVQKAFELHKPDLVFSVGTPVALAYLPAEIPTVYWGDSIMNQLAGWYYPVHKRLAEAADQLDRLALQKTKASIFSSDWAANAARRFVPESSDRIFTVPFGANTTSEPVPEGPKFLPADPSQTINFVFIGVDWNRKGGQDAVDALNILRSEGYNVRLSVVGARPYGDGEHPDFVQQYGFLRRNVEAEKKKLQQLNDEAHFFILPTHAECSAIVFAEAASYGLPVVARDVGGTSSMVDRNRSGILIDRGDRAKELADAIRPLLSDPERYRAMSAASLELFRRRLNWDNAVSHVIGIFEGVLKARAPTG